MLPVELRPLTEREIAFGAGVAARGLRDNPMPRGVLGPDPLHRVTILERTFRPFLRRIREPTISAWRGDYVVGVAGLAPPGRCQLSTMEVAGLLPRVRPRPRDLVRTLRWLEDWERRDLDEPHWHVGPVAVEGGLRGLGVGSQMMQALVERMDGDGAAAYLETDKPENVLFYERFGFETVDEGEVLGVRNWFMRRAPA